MKWAQVSEPGSVSGYPDDIVDKPAVRIALQEFGPVMRP